jgi:hypothetical protein
MLVGQFTLDLMKASHSHLKITAIWQDPAEPDPEALNQAFALIFRRRMPQSGQSTAGEFDKTDRNAKVPERR